MDELKGRKARNTAAFEAMNTRPTPDSAGDVPEWLDNLAAEIAHSHTDPVDLTDRYEEGRKAGLEEAAKVAEAAKFLCERLREFEGDITEPSETSGYFGHCQPALARLEDAIRNLAGGKHD